MFQIFNMRIEFVYLLRVKKKETKTEKNNF